MSEKPADASFVNAKAIRLLTNLLNESALTEIEYQEGETRIRVAKSTHQTVVASQALRAEAFSQGVGSTASGSSSGVALDSSDEKGEAFAGTPVTSPMVGTAYIAPEPGAAPYVRVGDVVQEGQTLLIIEAMKVMNPIRAPRSGKISAICITDNAPVEFGENLLYIN
ncbi:MAG: acetyl-CoA carboxylase biotin carboxyl carrier protein, partial [Alphaproteobacteria bacterium]